MTDTHLVVVTDIPFGSTYAYRRGQTIEKSAVEANGWQDYCVGRNTKEGREAQGLPEESTTTTAAGGKDK